MHLKIIIKHTLHKLKVHAFHKPEVQVFHKPEVQAFHKSDVQAFRSFLVFLTIFVTCHMLLKAVHILHCSRKQKKLPG